jgi:site-specific recombinase XerD
MWRFKQKQLTTNHFFINRDGGKLDVRSVQRWIKMAREEAGLPIKITPHSLRHQGAHELIDADANIKTVGNALGHSPHNLRGTAQYIHQNLVEKIKQAKKATNIRFGIQPIEI